MLSKTGQQVEEEMSLTAGSKLGPYVDGYIIAFVYSGLGDKDEAFRWLNRGIEQRSAGMVFLKCDPFLDRLHSDPRFPEVLRKIGLPQ